MIYRAIIYKIIPGEYKAKIRIPLLDKIPGAVASTMEQNLYDAVICVPPGCTPSYSPGEVVMVDFEDNDLSKPVILGVLYREETNSSMSLKCDSLNVEVDATLPKNTSIGNVDKDSLKSLEGIYGTVVTLEYLDEHYNE